MRFLDLRCRWVLLRPPPRVVGKTRPFIAPALLPRETRW
jgi:hypothetical protein